MREMDATGSGESAGGTIRRIAGVLLVACLCGPLPGAAQEQQPPNPLPHPQPGPIGFTLTRYPLVVRPRRYPRALLRPCPQREARRRHRPTAWC